MKENENPLQMKQDLFIQRYADYTNSSCSSVKKKSPKWAEDLNRHFSKEDKQMFKKHIRCSTLLIIKEIQAKTTMSYHFIPVRTVIIKKYTNSKCWRGCGEKGILLHCWQECKLIQLLWRIVWRFLKTLKIELLYDPASHSQAFIWRKLWFKRIHAPQCSLQYYSQQPRHGSKVNVHQQINR